MTPWLASTLGSIGLVLMVMGAVLTGLGVGLLIVGLASYTDPSESAFAPGRRRERPPGG